MTSAAMTAGVETQMDGSDALRRVGDGAQLDPVRVRAQLDRMLASPPFARAPRMQRFLSFLVEETLAGRGERLKEYAIAVSVFGKPSDFEPGISAVVRVEAGRLRRLLAQYQAEHGKEDSLVLQVPKGSYAPVFVERADAARPDSPAPAPRPSPAPAWAGEARRLVSVVSCAFGTEQTVSQGSAADDFIAVFDQLHEACASAAERHGGEVDAGSSDRLVIYFGWPNALEDAAGRALTAALQMLAEAQSRLPAGPLGVRIAVATSEVVARDAAGAGTRSRPPVVGEAPALAAEMLQHAPLNGILVAEATRRLTGAAFDFLPSGALDADAGEPNLLWRLLKAKPAVTRFRALHGGPPAALVGRREEAALVMSRWRLSHEGEGQAVILVGEAGIGKSRLAEAILAQMKREGAQLRVQCSSHHANSALYPIVELLKTRLGLGGDGPDPARLARLLAPLGLDEPLNRALLASLVADTAEPALEEMSASQRKDLTLRLLARILLALAGRRPTALLVEDVHWADPTTVELLHDLMRLAADQSLLLLLTSRPEAAPSFSQVSNLTSIQLTRLPRTACNELIDAMLSAARLSPASRALILEKADGVPLFLEELTKLFLASDAAAPRQPPVPESLSDLLASQLDRLGPTRSIAQVAAVIGRPFPRDMLVLASGRAEAEVDTALDQLLAARVLVKAGADAAQLFSFRHALLRDAAYGSLLDGARRALHYQVAGLLADSCPQAAGDNPEIIARHMMDAGRPDEAIPFWIDAGRKAADRYALAEAIADYRQALDALGALEPSRENRERELEVLIDLGLVIRNARGYGDEDLLAIYERARVLSAELGKPDHHANAVYGLWTHAAGRGQWRWAMTLARQFEALSAGGDQLEVEAHRLIGASAAFIGDFAAARVELDQVRALYDIDRHGPRFGFDPGAVAAAYLAWTVWHLGEREEAARHAADALAIADAHGHPSTQAMVLSWLMFHAVCEQDPAAVAAYNERLQLVCDERDCRYWQPFGAACAEWAAFQSDRAPRRLDRLLAAARRFREHYFTSCLLLMGAGMCLELGRSDQGLELVAQARAFIEAHDERLWEAEASRIEGELMLARGDGEPGRARLQQAAQTARRQGAVQLEQRAIASLATSADAPAKPLAFPGPKTRDGPSG